MKIFFQLLSLFVCVPRLIYCYLLYNNVVTTAKTQLLSSSEYCQWKENRLPWLTEKLRTQIKDKNAMHTMVILHPDNQLIRVKYKKQRNELTSLLRNSEINHYSDDLELHKSDLHKT